MPRRSKAQAIREAIEETKGKSFTVRDLMPLIARPSIIGLAITINNIRWEVSRLVKQQKISVVRKGACGKEAIYRVKPKNPIEKPTTVLPPPSNVSDILEKKENLSLKEIGEGIIENLLFHKNQARKFLSQLEEQRRINSQTIEHYRGIVKTKNKEIALLREQFQGLKANLQGVSTTYPLEELIRDRVENNKGQNQ